MTTLTSEAPANGLAFNVELFRSAELVVRRVGRFSDDVLVITFDAYTHYNHLDRHGFGQTFLLNHSIDAVHVIGSRNNWYQYPEMPEAMAAIAHIAAGYRRVITYGSSMGGYAAIRYGGVAGGQTALAISPQFSVDPAVVPFERRWRDSIHKIDFILERSWTPPFIGSAYVLCGRHTLDRRHCALIATRCRIVPVPIRKGGHRSAHPLAAHGLLQQAILDVAHGVFDSAAFSQIASEVLRGQRLRNYRALLKRFWARSCLSRPDPRN